MGNIKKYSVSLSFAGENREYVDQVARFLEGRGVHLFYDRNEQKKLWGTDGLETLTNIYLNESDYVVMFISKAYSEKPWAIAERRAALSAAMSKKAEYVLPVRFDDTELPGIPPTIQYVDGTKYKPAELAALISDKIGIPRYFGKASQVAKPCSEHFEGELEFNYSNNDGRYLIGRDPAVFETKWSKAGDGTIHIYNDPDTIHGVAIAEGISSFRELVDASKFDFSSRTRTANRGQFVILQNNYGLYAALEILEVQVGTGELTPKLRVRYAIQADGTTSFARFAHLDAPD